MDTFFKGLYSGMSGGVIINLWGFLLKDFLHISTRNYVDWTSVIIYGTLAANWYQFLLALFTHLLWTGFLGIVFAYLLPKLTHRGYRVKGALYGFILGFFIYSAAILLRMPFFTQIPLPTAAGNAIGGILWGIITAQILTWLETKFKHTA